jgi:hypothetical protein
MNNTFITIVLVFSLFLFVVFLTNTITIYAQQQMQPSSNTQPQKIPSQSPPSSSSSSPASPKAVKIISPTKGQQIPVGKDLTISGTSIDTSNSNCQVSMSVNHVKPYQPATAAGTGGANDYSKWNFVLTSNYTTIKPGPDNRITAKYTCTDNPVMVPSHSSVNVTGIVATAAAAPTTAYTLQQQTPKTSSNNTTTITNSVNKAPVSIPTNTPDSSKLLYLGINSKSANKADDTNTKTVAHHSSISSTSSSSSDDVGNKIKVHKISDSGSSSISSTSSSSSDDVGNKIKVHKLHPVVHGQPSTNIDHTDIDSVPPLISDNTFIHPHPFFQPHPFI